MRTNQEQRFGLWELAVLALLREAPMHPYQMQKLLRTRHKDELLVLKRGSLYHAINRLERAQLIEVVQTTREGKRPERTTYSITPSGKKELIRWLQRMIDTPRTESSDLMAALSFLPFLTVDDALKRLDERSRKLEAGIANITATMNSVSSWVPRIHLIENEYQRAMRQAELDWIGGLQKELHSGKLTWDLTKILKETRVVHERNQARTEARTEARAKAATPRKSPKEKTR
jgi:DNA-binding PadR family transcriptional regulator